MEGRIKVNRVILKGRKVVGGRAEGEALVTRQTISTWGGVDARQGMITERRHEIRGQSFTGKVLVFPSAKGSSGWSTVAQIIRLSGKAPLAMIIREINSSDWYWRGHNAGPNGYGFRPRSHYGHCHGGLGKD